MVRDVGFCACCGRIEPIVFKFVLDGCGIGSGVDHENDGVAALCAGALYVCCEAVLGVASQLESRAFEEPLDVRFPLTNASKSTSPPSPAALLEEAKALGPVKDMKSSLLLICPFEPARSCSFLDCSDSTRAERLLISSMKA